MDFKEFISKTTFHNDGLGGFEELCEALGRCIYCNFCPLYGECHKPENIKFSCADILKKYLTIE